MLKKMLLVAVIGGCAVAALKGTRFFGLAKSEIENAAEWVDSKVPVEKDIARLRKEVAGLDKDRAKVADLLAKEIVDVRYLRENTEELKAAIKVDSEKLQARAELVKDATERVKYGSTMVPVGEAKDLLKADVARHVAKKNTLDSQEKALAARERNKELLEKQLDALKRQKDDLAAQIDTFEAEYKALQLQQMEAKYQTDNTRLAGIKESLRNLKMKVEVQRERLNMEPKVQEETGAGSAAGLSVDEIMAPVEGKKAEKKATK